MKKLFTLSLLMAFGLFVNAQITVTNNDLAPAGTTIINSIDNSVDDIIVPGSPGPDKTWDFSILNQDNIDTLKFMLPAWTPYPDNFPDANFAANLVNDNAYAFLIRNDDKLSAIGLVGSYDVYENVSVPVVPEEVYMDFPVQFGQTRDENFYIEARLESNTPPADSVKYRQRTVKSTLVDAWGTLTLPMGSYNTLRVKEERTIYDSVWGKVFGTWLLVQTNQSSSTLYKWITNDASLGYYLVTMNYNTSNQTVNSVEFMNMMPVGVENHMEEVVLAYPNPVKDILHFDMKNIAKGKVLIYNLNGQLLVNKEFTGVKTSVSVSALPNGVYFYVIKDENSNKISSNKFIKN